MRPGEEDRDYKPFRRGWFFSEAEIKEEILELVHQTRAPQDSGEEIHEGEEHRANRFFKTLLSKMRWTESTLRSTPKGPPEKIQLAQALRQQTTMTIP